MFTSKKAFALLSALALGVTLTACGGGGDQGGSATTAAATTTAATTAATTTEPKTTAPATPAPSFEGTWKLAGVNSAGAIMTGNMVEMMDLGEMSTLTLNADGTGELGSTGEGTFKWTKESATKATAVPTGNAEFSFSLSCEEAGVIALDMSDGEVTMSMLFTADGTLPQYPVVDLTKATAITDAKDIVGDWKLSSMSYSGVMIYGDIQGFLKNSGMEDEGEITSLSLVADGSGKIGSTAASWKIENGVATFTEGDGSALASVSTMQRLGDQLVLQVGGAESSLGMAFIYSK